MRRCSGPARSPTAELSGRRRRRRGSYERRPAVFGPDALGDDEATIAELVEKRRLSFPIGHSVDADAFSELTGAYTNDDPKYVQSTGFVLAPDGTIVTAVYSSGAIGRLVPEDVLGLVTYIKSQ